MSLLLVVLPLELTELQKSPVNRRVRRPDVRSEANNGSACHTQGFYHPFPEKVNEKLSFLGPETAMQGPAIVTADLVWRPQMNFLLTKRGTQW